MIITDMHTHSHLSGDCLVPIEEMIKAAQVKGLQYYAVTDHHDIDFPECGIDFFLDIEAANKTIQPLKALNTSKFQLLQGIEYGLQPYLKDDLKQLSQTSDYDLIIGSCHLGGGMDPYDKAYFNNRTKEEGYRIYFESTLKCVQEMDGFDVLGHMDYAIRYWRGEGQRQYKYRDYGLIFDAILEILIRKDIALEVNTAGYPYKLNQPNPAFDVLTRYYQLGGELLTIGSDAHVTANIASHFDVVEAKLIAIGFKSYTAYVKRQPIQIGFV